VSPWNQCEISVGTENRNTRGWLCCLLTTELQKLKFNAVMPTVGQFVRTLGKDILYGTEV